MERVNTCVVCSKFSKTHCSKCRANYCSKECQLIDWKNGHKKICRLNDTPAQTLLYSSVVKEIQADPRFQNCIQHIADKFIPIHGTKGVYFINILEKESITFKEFKEAKEWIGNSKKIPEAKKRMVELLSQYEKKNQPKMIVYTHILGDSGYLEVFDIKNDEDALRTWMEKCFS
jgi:hypothetical protein